MKYLVFFFALISFQLNCVIGQNSYVDSLKNELPKAKTDSAKALINTELCWTLRLENQSEALHYGRKARSHAYKQTSKKVLGDVLNDLSIIFLDKGELDSAQNLLQKALELRQLLNDEVGIASIHNKLVILYQNISDYEKAIFHTVEALAFYESINHKPYIAYCLNNLAAFQREIKNYPEARKRNKELLTLRAELKDTLGLASTHGNLASVYSQMGEYDSSRFHFEKATMMFSVIDAKTYLQKSQKASTQNNFTDELLHVYKNLGLLFSKQKNADSSQYYNSKYIDLLTAQYKENIEKQVSEIETKYQTAKKEKALFEEQAKNSNLLKDNADAELIISNKNKSIFALLALFIAVLSVLAIAVIIYRKRVEASKAKLLIEEQEKRILAVISAQEEERKRIAKDLHDGIVQDLTAIKMSIRKIGEITSADENHQISKVEKELERCVKETRDISHQMMPAALREFGLIPALEDLFERSFRPIDILYDFEHSKIQQRMEEKVEVSLFRITQELVNNAVKHSKASVVLITLSIGKNYINLIFEDNGRGFDTKKVKRGLGINNLSSRVQYINGTFIFESAANEGSTAIIRIPYQSPA